jgi:hypothetical protein
LEKLKLSGFSTLCMEFAVRVKNYAKMEGCSVPVQSLEKLKLNGFSTLCRRFAVRVRNHAKMVDC